MINAEEFIAAEMVKDELEQGDDSFKVYEDFHDYVAEIYPNMRCTRWLFDLYLEIGKLSPRNFYKRYQNVFDSWDTDFELTYGDKF